MKAVISSVEKLKPEETAHITSDSSYVLNGITKWVADWKKKDWKTTKKEPVLNVDLWKKLDVLVSTRDIAWSWIKGHSGHKYNEEVDKLAKEQAFEAKNFSMNKRKANSKHMKINQF